MTSLHVRNFFYDLESFFLSYKVDLTFFSNNNSNVTSYVIPFALAAKEVCAQNFSLNIGGGILI
jgi:hypothetical protein